MGNNDVMHRIGKIAKMNTADGGADSASSADAGPAHAATADDTRSNDEKHAGLLKGAGPARVRTREELTHRASATPASERSDKARRRNMAIGLVLAVVVVVAVLAMVMLLGANSAL